MVNLSIYLCLLFYTLTLSRKLYPLPVSSWTYAEYWNDNEAVRLPQCSKNWSCIVFKHILFVNYIDKMDKTQVKQTYEIVSKL